MVVDGMIRRIRTSGKNPALGETWGHWASWPTRAITGATVNDASALSLTAFYRGISLIAGTIGGLPLQVFEEDIDSSGNEGETRKLKSKDTAYLWRRPNPEMTMQSLWERVVADEVRGNGFLFVEKTDPLNIWHLERQRVRVGRTKSGVKVYEVDDELPMIDYKQGGEIVHIPNWGDGLVGYDPVRVASEAIALGISAQEYVARFLGQGFNPPGLLTSDMTISEEDSEKISARWQRQYGGVSRVGRIPVLGSGAKYQQIAVDMERFEMNSLRRFSVAEIARLLGLPPHLLADVERSTSWGSGIEEQNRNLMTFTLAAHIRRIELAVTDDLLVRELTNRYAKFNVAAILRGTTLQQYQAFALGYGRWLTPNDIRRSLDMPEIEGGDTLPTASNLIPIEDLGANFRELPAGGE